MKLFSHYNLNQSFTWRWYHPKNQRYYRAALHKDLLNDWCLTKSWGSTLTKQGQVVSTCCQSWETGIKAVEKIHAARLKHGYHVIDN